MRKEKKLKESEYFLNQMKLNENDYEAFGYNLSAFVNSARSVLQYALKETEHIPSTKKWFLDTVKKNKIIQFFKDKRDINIHTKPVRINSRSVTIKLGLQYVMKGEKANKEWRPPTSETVNKFTNWDGTEEDVFSACKKYLSEIRLVLEEGKQKGYLG